MSLRNLSAILCLSGTCLFAPATLADRPDFSEAVKVLEDAVDDGAFPGATAIAGTSREILWIGAAGHLDLERKRQVTPETIYDLASLTKIVGTTTVVLTLVRDGVISLDDPIAKVLTEFPEHAATPAEREWRQAVTIRHLLTHSSGLPAWRPLYREANGLEEVVSRALTVPLEAAPGTRSVYSDIGLILLGELASRAGGHPLATLEEERIFRPLGLRHTRRAVPDGWKEWTAPTERVSPDGPAIHGVVHDENARAANGLTGHAGLFSTAYDMATFAAEWLRAIRGESAILPAELAREFTTRAEIVSGSSRAIGWDTPSGRSSAGTILSRRSFGHTGFTGTSMWLDPERDLFVILLSNRVHPTRDNHRIGSVRPALANAVAKAFDAALAAGDPEPVRAGETR